MLRLKEASLGSSSARSSDLPWSDEDSNAAAEIAATPSCENLHPMSPGAPVDSCIADGISDQAGAPDSTRMRSPSQLATVACTNGPTYFDSSVMQATAPDALASPSSLVSLALSSLRSSQMLAAAAATQARR